MRDLQRLVDAADVTELMLAIDALASTRDWDGLVDLARRCRAAIELGRQLWAVAMHIDYRLALEGPAPYAAAVVKPGTGRFTLGPLSEVAASVHPWSALAPHLEGTVAATAVAQERVLRGEDLRDAADPALRTASELPLVAQPWEPAYALPRYRDRSAAFPQPEVAVRTLPPPAAVEVGDALEPDAGVEALRQLVEVWVSESAGRVSAVTVAGPAPAAVGCLLSDRDAAPHARIAAISGAEALAFLQWTGASGGAYGRRRGGAAGRFAAWWTAAMLAGLEWPAGGDELGAAVSELDWFRWGVTEPERGWVLRLAVADPVDGLAWAVEALDEREDAGLEDDGAGVAS